MPLFLYNIKLAYIYFQIQPLKYIFFAIISQPFNFKQEQILFTPTYITKEVNYLYQFNGTSKSYLGARNTCSIVYSFGW